MSELADTFIEARFEKKANPEAEPKPKALLDRIMGAPARRFELGQLTPELKDIRRAIERSIAKEEELRRRVQAAGRFAQRAAVRPPEPGWTEKLVDLFPTLATTTTAGTVLGSMTTPRRVQKMIGQIKPSDLSPMLKEIGEQLGVAGDLTAGQLAQALGSRGWLPRTIGKIPGLKWLFGSALKDFKLDPQAVSKLQPSVVSSALTRLKQQARAAAPNVRNWSPWLGAGAGLVAGLTPTLLSHYSRMRKAKEYGGVQALEAHEKAREYARRAEALRRWREAQLEQLAVPELTPDKVTKVPFEEFEAQVPNIRFGPRTTP